MANAEYSETAHLYLGVLSGTSIDGIDVALVAFDPHASLPIQLVSAHTFPIPSALKNKLTQLCVPYAGDEITALGTAHREFSLCTAAAINTFLTAHKVAPEAIRAIAFHGQTIRHHPDIETPFTWQLGCPDTLAVATSIPVISSFRDKDIALGGQGAPLAPAFHEAVFGAVEETRAVVNLGGIANITWLAPNKPITGFDCGPASTLLDYWYQKHHDNAQVSYDEKGAWAASGRLIPALVDACLEDPYFAKEPPKSTGREYFTPTWLEEKLATFKQVPKPEDVQASLLELTAVSLTNALTRFAPAKKVFCCGGGVHNEALITRCAALTPSSEWSSTEALGIAPDWVEAILFAWLGWRFDQGLATDLTTVTGASRPAVLGRYTPAS